MSSCMKEGPIEKMLGVKLEGPIINTEGKKEDRHEGGSARGTQKKEECREGNSFGEGFRKQTDPLAFVISQKMEKGKMKGEFTRKGKGAKEKSRKGGKKKSSGGKKGNGEREIERAQRGGKEKRAKPGSATMELGSRGLLWRIRILHSGGALGGLGREGEVPKSPKGRGENSKLKTRAVIIGGYVAGDHHEKKRFRPLRKTENISQGIGGGGGKKCRSGWGNYKKR